MGLSTRYTLTNVFTTQLIDRKTKNYTSKQYLSGIHVIQIYNVNYIFLCDAYFKNDVASFLFFKATESLGLYILHSNTNIYVTNDNAQ